MGRKHRSRDEVERIVQRFAASGMRFRAIPGRENACSQRNIYARAIQRLGLENEIKAAKISGIEDFFVLVRFWPQLRRQDNESGL